MGPLQKIQILYITTLTGRHQGSVHTASDNNNPKSYKIIWFINFKPGWYVFRLEKSYGLAIRTRRSKVLMDLDMIV